jgi:hypothetical protein
LGAALWATPTIVVELVTGGLAGAAVVGVVAVALGTVVLGGTVAAGIELVGATVPGCEPVAGAVMVGVVAAWLVGAVVAGVVVVPWTRADAGIGRPRAVLVLLAAPIAVAAGEIETRAAAAATQSRVVRGR